MYEKNTIFKTKLVVLENTLLNVGKNKGLPSEANVLENFPKQSWSSSEMICWTVSQPHSPENHPVKFLSQPCLFFQKIHVMHSHLISRLPSAYENALCHFNQYIYQYATFSILHSQHMSFTIDQPSPKLAHLSNSHYHLQWPTNTITIYILCHFVNTFKIMY